MKNTKKILRLPINQSSFTEWYYSDQSTSELRSIAYDLINTLTSTGEFKITVKHLFDNCGYFPINLLDIEEELADQLREAFDSDEIEDITGEVLGRKYKIVLIS